AEPAKVAPGASAEPEIVDGGWWQVSHSAYVPASVHEVWVLLDDVTRRPEWDTALAAVRPVEPERSGRWIGEARTRPSGRGRWRVPRRARISIIERIEREECRRIAWQTTYPRLDESYDRRLRIKLEEQPRGTRVHLTLQGRRPRVLANVRLRVRCFLAASELTRLASGISRRFRS